MKTKYVVMFDFELDIEIPYVFPECINHVDFVKSIVQEPMHASHPVSAGFCLIDRQGQYVTYGNSISLNLSSRPDDAKLLNRFLVGDR